MKKDELPKPYHSALLLEQQSLIPTSLEGAEAIAPAAEHEVLSPQDLQEDDVWHQVDPFNVGSMTLNHTSKLKAVSSFDLSTNSDIVDDAVDLQDTKMSLPLETLPLPAFPLRHITLKDVKTNLHRYVNPPAINRKNLNTSIWGYIKASLLADKWLIAAFVLACAAGGFSLWYFFVTHQTLLYGDANAHLLISRRVFDNLTPGLAQLGAIWLPLPHVLMIPLVWNDFLWRTGLAGSIVSLLCYIVAALFIFLSARRFTNNGLASLIGTLVFILNPNILYLQSTPLSELVLMAALAATCYYFLVWAQTDSTKYLILTAGTTFLTTLSRYDGWFLFVAIFLSIVAVGIVRRHRHTRIEANLFLYTTMGGLGIILWFAWNMLIFNDPLYFQRGPFSAQAQQKDLIKSHLLYTYHDLYESVRYYVINCIDIIGPVLFGIGVLAILVFVVQRRFKPEMFAGLIFMSPILFYVISLYTGQAALYLPTAVPGYAPYTLFNARYGEVIVMPVAIFLACLVALFSRPQHRASLKNFFVPTIGRFVGRYIFPILCLGIIVGQSLWIVDTGIITLQDGVDGLACTPTHSVVIYLAQHYNGGKILEDLYTSKIDTLEVTAGIHFQNIIYEGSGHLWTEALSNPQSVVDWIIVNPTDPNDAISNKIHIKSNVFTKQFDFVLQEQNGVALYHHSGRPPLPTYDVGRGPFTDHARCGEQSPARFGSVPGVLSQDEILGKATYL